MKIVYMGTPEFAVEPLRLLVERGYAVEAVVTMPDKPSGRGLKLNESAVKRYARSAGIPVLQPEKLKDEGFLQQLRGINADLFIVVAFRMLPEVVWTMPRLGTFNLHASLLPQYRGAAPVSWAIINGETETGVTTFFLQHEIDTGSIIFQEKVPIKPDDNVGSLYDKLMKAGAELVIKTVDAIDKGKVDPTPQVSSQEERPKEAPKIFKETCRIDWSKKGADIVNLIRGLSPYPSAFSHFIGNATEVQVKIFAASFEEKVHNAGLGTYFSDEKTYLKVACIDGFVFLKELQLAGKKRLNIQDFLRGFKAESFQRLE
ncbi:MAG: methionyl-tRNA formyltransferase [Prevotellaceae bacterium]|jgi:methionyl-tRNA formyltransferase|nr:methionyl-tRNA formyltransferase [Prevotellaceae bacterium]